MEPTFVPVDDVKAAINALTYICTRQTNADALVVFKRRIDRTTFFNAFANHPSMLDNITYKTPNDAEWPKILTHKSAYIHFISVEALAELYESDQLTFNHWHISNAFVGLDVENEVVNALVKRMKTYHGHNDMTGHIFFPDPRIYL